MKINNIAAVVSGMDEEYPYQIMLGINQFAREHNINVSYFAAFGGIIESEDFNDGEYSIYNLPNFSDFDGALLLTNTFSNPKVRNRIIEKVKKSGIPVVIFECRDHEEFHDVSINNYNVMKKLVEHLITEHDAKVFHYISGPVANPEASDRYRAFRDALSENGIPFDEEKRFFKGYFRSYDGIKAIEAFEQSGLPLPDVFVSANDSMALTAMNCLQQKGYRIPEDVIVTGFDHTFNAQNSYPVLTTVKRPLKHSGMVACDALLKLIEGKELPRSICLEAEPVFSESCGCHDEEQDNIQEFKKNMYQRIGRTYTNAHLLNRLIAALAGAENIGDCIESIEQMLRVLGCNDFSLCLVHDWETTYNISHGREEEGYHPLMTAPFVYENGVRSAVSSFPSRQLFPIPLATGGNISYFLPLHFNQRCLGYYIIKNNDFPIYNLHCHTMTMSIGNAIDAISKINVLDPLCKVYNRTGFERNAEMLFKECVNSGVSLTICFIDLDGLKKINDNYGHKEGDFAIKSISDAIENSCDQTAICGRFGGDEFVVLGVGDHFQEMFQEQFAAYLAKVNREAGKAYEVAASLGFVTATPTKEDSLPDLIQTADARMYEIKKKKKAARG